jgi:hypothetical protein
MSIPLDRLYHYIESVAQEITSDNVIIYRFFPHGSKKIEDLNLLRSHPSIDTLTKPVIICYDQEPLSYDLYSNCVRGAPVTNQLPHPFLTDSEIEFFKLNLRYSPHNVYDKCLLLHSELNSNEVEKYAQNQFVPVYYWNHAILARDWYRYAEHIKCTQSISTKKFLVYNRAWTGTREYRLKLADLLIDYQLVDHCQTSCSFIDHDTNIHYLQHKLINSQWAPVHDLEQYYLSNCYPAYSSADFDLQDYQITDIELILETLFDDTRLQLTEKSLRPLALGHPFILLGPPGSLTYLKKYGFKTFDGLIDESYDGITDSSQRLQAVVKLMRTIADLPPQQYQDLISKMHTVAQFNKNYFFSNNFMNLVTQELKENLAQGINELISTNTYQRFQKFRQAIMQNKEYLQWRDLHVTHEHIVKYNDVYQQILDQTHQ